LKRRHRRELSVRHIRSKLVSDKYERIVVEVDRVSGMLQYERDKMKEMEEIRSKVEMECGRLESENKVLGLKIER
jgi:hypothetical protein